MQIEMIDSERVNINVSAHPFYLTFQSDNAHVDSPLNSTKMRLLITSKSQQIDDTAICESSEANFGTNEFSNGPEEKEPENQMESFTAREMAFQTIMWNVQYDSGKVVIIHYGICAIAAAAAMQAGERNRAFCQHFVWKKPSETVSCDELATIHKLLSLRFTWFFSRSLLCRN